VTGWRVGWVIAPPALNDSIRKMHDFLTVGAAAPLQDAGAVAVAMPDEYYDGLARAYTTRRDRLMGILRGAGFDVLVPEGAYYLMCDIAGWGYPDDVRFCRYLIEEVGVAAVPGSSFFRNPESGHGLIRFTFCKSEATLAMAEERFRAIRPMASSGSGG
jgi:aspartate/methionine/tyrosine aminotransferase